MAASDPAPAFETDRLAIAPWGREIGAAAARARLGAALAPLLTPEITHRLPASMGFDPARDRIGTWIARADGDAAVYTVRLRDGGALAGLMLLFEAPDSPDGAALMLGYFLGPAFHGRGLGSELVAGLVMALDKEPARRLLAGVDADNIGSQRVLEKAGFSRISDPDARPFFRRDCGRG